MTHWVDVATVRVSRGRPRPPHRARPCVRLAVIPGARAGDRFLEAEEGVTSEYQGMSFGPVDHFPEGDVVWRVLGVNHQRCILRAV